MNRFTILIEETASATFSVDAENVTDALKIAEEKYKKCEFVLEPGNLIDLRIKAIQDNI